MNLVKRVVGVVMMVALNLVERLDERKLDRQIGEFITALQDANVQAANNAQMDREIADFEKERYAKVEDICDCGTPMNRGDECCEECAFINATEGQQE